MIAHDVAVDLLVRAERRAVGRLVRIDVDVARAVPAAEPDPPQPARAFLDGDEAREHVERRDEHVRVVRDHLAPVRAVVRAPGRRVHDAEIERLPVRADDPAIVDVVHGVLVSALARQQHFEPQVRVVHARKAHFGRDRAARVDQQVTPVLGDFDRRVESLVRLLVHERVGGRVRPEHVLAHAHAEQRDRILLDVKHRAVVARPGHPLLDVADCVGQDHAGFEHLEPERVLAAPDRVVRVRQQPVIVAHLERADVVIVEPARLRLEVEQDLLRPLETARASRIDGIFVARVEATVIEVTLVTVRHRRVVLPDAADDLRVELVLERFQPTEQCFPVCVLRPEVREHRRVTTRVVAQPVVLVDPGAARGIDLVGPDLGDGWPHHPVHGVAFRRPPGPCAPVAGAACPAPGSTASSSAPARRGAAGAAHRSDGCSGTQAAPRHRRPAPSSATA